MRKCRLHVHCRHHPSNQVLAAEQKAAPGRPLSQRSRDDLTGTDPRFIQASSCCIATSPKPYTQMGSRSLMLTSGLGDTWANQLLCSTSLFLMAKEGGNYCSGKNFCSVAEKSWELLICLCVNVQSWNKLPMGVISQHQLVNHLSSHTGFLSS